MTASADGDVVTARLPLDATSEVEVDCGWNAQSFSGDRLAGRLHSDRCFANSTTEPLKVSGTVSPSRWAVRGLVPALGASSAR